MTGWSDILTDAGVIIDDLRWYQDLNTSPALYYRAKIRYVKLALPMLNRPPALLEYLEKGMTEPLFADTSWTSDAASLQSATQIETGMIGFELCSVCIRTENGTGLAPYSEAAYNAETGIVTMPQQALEGVEYSIDFYTDGSFAAMTPTMRRLFAMAVACVWDERFDRNWLNMQMKIKDSSFETGNEANYMKSTSSRKLVNRGLLGDELRKYEQDCAYRSRFRTAYDGVLI